MTTAIPVLTFHAIEELPSVISISPQVFQRGIDRLQRDGYQTLDLVEAADIIRKRESFPPRSFVITFDDGYQSVYDHALPVLQTCGMTATVFLTVGTTDAADSKDRLPGLENRSMLSWDEICEMHRYGMDFGAHTLTHPDLTQLMTHQMETEIYRSKTIIEEVLGSAVACFAYPFGRSDDRSCAFVRRHFDCACSDRLGFINAGSDLFALERIDAYYLRTERLFGIMLTKFFPWYILARGLLRRMRRFRR